MKLVAISAVWCSACIITMPRVREISKDYPYTLEELDYDMDSEMVEKYNVGTLIPVLIIEDENGVEIERIKGEKNKKEIMEFLERNLERDLERDKK